MPTPTPLVEGSPGFMVVFTEDACKMAARNWLEFFTTKKKLKTCTTFQNKILHKDLSSQNGYLFFTSFQRHMSNILAILV